MTDSIHDIGAPGTIIGTPKIYPLQHDAERIRFELQFNDPDWRYKLMPCEGGWKIAVYDESREFTGYWQGV